MDFTVVHLLKNLKEALGALAGATLCHHALVELIGERDAWDRKIHASRLIQNNTEILDEVLDVEARLEVALELTRAQVSQLEAACTTLREQGNHLLMVETSLLCVEESLADADLVAGDHHLVSSLSVLTSAGATHELHILRVDIEEVLRRGEALISTTDHRHKVSVLSTGITTRNWSVHREHTSILGSLSNLDCKGRAARRVVDQG